MSYATTIRGTGASRRSTRTKAAPTARATSSLSWSGTVPRTSYAFTIRERSATDPLLTVSSRSTVDRAQPNEAWLRPGVRHVPSRRRPGPRRVEHLKIDAGEYHD